MRINNGGPAASLDSIVLFPFDDHSIPFQHGVHLQGRQTGHDNKRVVPLGEPGAHDSLWIAFYGTVLAIDGELWMWYLGQGPDEHWHSISPPSSKARASRMWATRPCSGTHRGRRRRVTACALPAGRAIGWATSPHTMPASGRTRLRRTHTLSLRPSIWREARHVSP